MTVSGVTTNNYVVDTIGENPKNDTNITTYNELSNKWNTYSSNEYLSDDFKKEIKTKLDELKNLVNLSEEEKNNDEIADLIADLKDIINGNNSMISLADRVNCFEEISKYQNYLNNASININTFRKKLNNVNSTYKDTNTFYNDLFVPILESKNGLLDPNDYTTIESNIANGKYSSVDSSENFFNDLTRYHVSYSINKQEQDNILFASRINLSNKTLSMKVLQENNAYKLLEIDNLVSEALNKRAETDPAMKRLRDGNYWTDNKEVKHQDSINHEDELWTKKQE